MNVLVVVETAFGNTRTAAERVAEGLNKANEQTNVELVTVEHAPESVPQDVDLLLVGGPTHDFSMSKPGTRAQAVDKGAEEVASEGIREWIARLNPRGGVRVLTFDTALEQWLSGSAAKAAAKALRKKGFDQVEHGPSFHVGGREGPLREGEEERARTWGAQLL